MAHNGSDRSVQGSNLQAYPTTFVGRREEVAEIAKVLADPTCRLLTLVGVGGVGKTRLAIQVATEIQDAFADGAHFVPLQSVQSTEFLISDIADILGLSLAGGSDLVSQLFHYLRDKEMLLVLDNFEQLLTEGGADLVVDLLRATDGVKLLVTSREVLNARDEWLYPVQGLAVPSSAAVAELESYGAVELFARQAVRVRRDFSLEEEQASVVRICQLVEGMPLAIELAASWVRTLRCAAILAEIQSDRNFLRTSMRDMPDRHQSVKAAFDHSWKRLPQEAQEVFKRLSVFRDGFQRGAAEAVAGASLPVLASLVDSSLVRYDAGGRYHVHELLRQYGEEKLQGSAEEKHRVHNLHSQYYADFLHRRLEMVKGTGQQQASTEISAELENVRAAWQWGVTYSKVDVIQKAATVFYYFCQFKSYFLEGVNALEAASASIERLPASTRRDQTLAQLFDYQGWFLIRIGDFARARRVLERSRAIYDRLDTPPLPAMGTDPAVPLAIVALIQGDHDSAVALCESARQASKVRGDQHNLSFALYGLTAARLAQGRYEAAYRHAERACALARAVGNRWYLAYPLTEWGNVARAMGNYAEAEKHFHNSYCIKKEFNDPAGVAMALSRLGEIAVLQEDCLEAQQLFQQSLEIYRNLDDRGGRARSLKGLGQVAYALQDFTTARKHFQQALRVATEIGFLPLVCSIIVDMETLLQQQDAQALSVALLTLVQQHPASDHETNTQAQQRLNDYEATMAPTDFAAAVHRGNSWDLDMAVATLQAEFTVPVEPDTIQPDPDQPLSEPLTDRELEVLRLMAEGYTNAEIAEELVVALGTTKWYASQIYGKLNVANRTEAAARARQLDLLD